MHRGRALQPEAGCAFCNKPLPALRHPNSKYCDHICRGRDRWQRGHSAKGIRCLECNKLFVRVGSHVVQAHGYERVLEYKREYGLMGRETRTNEHASLMRSKVTEHAINNLKKGVQSRFTKDDNHSKVLKEFWNNRHSKKSNLKDSHE